MSQWCDYLSFDIMSQTVFSGDYNLIGTPENRGIMKAIEESNVRVGVLTQAPGLRRFGIDQYLFKQSIIARSVFLKFAKRMIGDRLKKMADKNFATKDIFSFMSKVKDSTATLSVKELSAESITLIVAGSDTSSTTMAGLFYYLSRHPKSYARVADEVRKTFNSIEDIKTGPLLNSCVYLRACIDESMRMSPSVVTVLWREVLEGGAKIDGKLIPAGVDVGTSVYSIHHNHKYFPDPFQFRPERWLPDENPLGASGVELARAAHNPFSFGPRSCIGKGMALHEILLTIPMILWQFDFEAVDSPGMVKGSSPEEFVLGDHISSSKGEVGVRFRIRR
ncbi:hypothetical protein B7463_g11785, partial [Scytalidium lignicola]